MEKNKHYTITNKRLWSTLLLLISLVAASFGTVYSNAFASNQAQIAIYVDRKEIKWSTQPVIIQNTTFVPLRDFVQGIGAQLQWDAANQSITIQHEKNTIIHQIGTDGLTLNGDKLEMAQASQLIRNTTYIPVRPLVDALQGSLDVWVTAQWTMIDVSLKEQQQDSLSPKMAKVDTYLRNHRFMGTALIAQKGQILLVQGYGPAGAGKMNEPGMKSRVASISKQFTAVAILKLSEAGKLDLSDTLDAYIPDFPRASEITIHMLLSNTSGLPADFPRVKGATLEETVTAVKKMNLRFEPGTQYRYSNPGYVLLAYIIEKASGMDYGSYLQKIIFDPLQMSNTGEATPDTDTIKGHRLVNGRLTETNYYVSQSGTGSLYSTVYDLLKWDRALYTEEILSQESIEKMYAPGLQKDNYGYGWEIEQADRSRIVTTTGGGTGYTTLISRNLENETAIILLSNQQRIDIKKMRLDIQKLMTGAESYSSINNETGK